MLLRAASMLRTIDASMAERLSPAVIQRIVELIPDSWLEDGATEGDELPDRAAYARYLSERLTEPRAFVAEAADAR